MYPSRTPRTDEVEAQQHPSAWNAHQAALALCRTLERELAEAHYNFEVLKAKDDEAIEADRFVSRALGRADRDTEVAELREALERLLGCPPNCRKDDHPGCAVCMAPTNEILRRAREMALQRLTDFDQEHGI